MASLSDDALARRIAEIASASKARVEAGAGIFSSHDFRPVPEEGAGDVEWAEYFAILAENLSCSHEQLSMLPAQPAEVAPGVFLGGLDEAEAQSALMALNIDCILNMASCFCGPSSRRGYPKHFETLDIDAQDAEDYDIFSYDVPRALEFLQRCLGDGRRVLVHCYAGMNRSATVCAVWLLQQQRWPLGDIVRHLACKRGLVLQNITFLKGLVLMARESGLLSDAPPLSKVRTPTAHSASALNSQVRQ
eukprot:gnl/MRDRNA2_/MRDRNA2_24357_c0_seq1.p1 gnl/MRDRNA2_/MRDRNA2_24357_c0~~gnl/MRDRNA2_/MRDRNA2_24357_c0_seq1.p1  ORF type:complete len:256 (-),score=48.35 gnl/MRDRNA2_/MRDRNA2_24357_c0_seq1:200-943(-)